MAVISKVDLRGIKPGGQAWAEARATVTASMEAVGVVLVTHDALAADLRRAMFCRAMPEFFALPLDVKRRLISGPVNGYIARSPTASMPAYESVRIWEKTDGGGAHNIGDVVWPHGNTEFCDTVETFANNMMDLERTVGTMILEGLGVRQELIDAHNESIAHNVRLSHYGSLPEMRMPDLSMRAHRDNGTLNVVVQHEVEGLEVQTEDGSWITVPPDSDTVAIIAGEMLTVATNGRVPACLHRVRTPSNRERLSALLSSMPKDGFTVRPLDDLVDDDHPLQYNACNFNEYVDFRFAAGRNPTASDTLIVFCGTVN